MLARSLACALLGLLLVPGGCGGGGGDGDGAGGPDGGGGGDCDDPPCLEVPEQGFQVRNEGATIQPGEDVEYCEVVLLPGSAADTYHVNRFASQMTTGSHHLIVAAIVPGSSTDSNAQPGDRVECFGPSGFGGDLLDVTGQQLPYHEESFPPGVGKVFTGGQKLVFNYHYLNASERPLQARAAVNFHTTDEENVQKIAENFGFFFLGIDVPPGEQRSYTIRCEIGTDVMVHKLTRHTHQWGTDFPVWFSGGERDGQLIYTSPNYEAPDHVFEEPVLVEAGQGFRFTCNYNNTSDKTLSFGETVTDEMCILFGTIYSPTAREVPGEHGCIKFVSE
jgi:hypothetical protein